MIAPARSVAGHQAVSCSDGGAQLAALYQHSGALRNAAGVAYGSLDLEGPQASVALLGLRLSGTHVSFLAERWPQMRSRPAL